MERSVIVYGGHITLINSVISSIPIYQLSFFKVPSKILKVIISIQRNFLWHGSCEKGGLMLQSWDSICNSKGEGGSGIKDVVLFNKALMSKWIWRCLSEEESVWKNPIQHIYGDVGRRLGAGLGYRNKAKESLRWRDILFLNERMSENLGVSSWLTWRL